MEVWHLLGINILINVIKFLLWRLVYRKVHHPCYQQDKLGIRFKIPKEHCDIQSESKCLEVNHHLIEQGMPLSPNIVEVALVVAVPLRKQRKYEEPEEI